MMVDVERVYNTVNSDSRFARNVELKTLQLLGTNDDEIQGVAFGPANVHWTLDDFQNQVRATSDPFLSMYFHRCNGRLSSHSI